MVEMLLRQIHAPNDKERKMIKETINKQKINSEPSYSKGCHVR